MAVTRIADRQFMLFDFASTAWRDLGIAHVGEVTWLNDTLILAEPYADGSASAQPDDLALTSAFWTAVP